MTSVATQIVALGPVGRLPRRLAVLIADVVGLALALLAHEGGLVVYSIMTAVLVFGSAWLMQSHLSSVASPGRSCVLTRLPGIVVALGAAVTPWWLFLTIFVLYELSGQFRIPPLRWFSGWLPAGASQVAVDVVAGSVLLVASTVIAF